MNSTNFIYKLVDGRSAALTKSLARRYGLKTGDEFEVLTADGEIMVRTYDDTVPTTYKGKPLPETVDLYETRGSNSFGGTVVGIRKLSKKPDSRSLDLVAD
jgi:bifunctional DNA-binding transcriptional regulator/antitoxin component of YhaV-PrlF toxin-antitoxin module